MKSGKQRYLVGIDLGTSYSSLCYLDDEFEARPVPNKEGDYKTPSAVYFAKGGAGLIVGTNALAPGFSNPERFVSHAKRYLGEPNVHWEIDGIRYTPVDILSFILRKLIQDAEKEIGPINKAVITVPAHYNHLQRKLTVNAGTQAGLETVCLLNEPVAAAICFALGAGGKEMLYLRDAGNVLIYDLGGGTFDLSLIRFDRTQLRVLSTSGELLLGGLDWDQRLIDKYISTFKLIHDIDLAAPHNHKSLRRLACEVENAKRRLSDPAITKTELFFQHGGLDAEYEVSRAEFEQETADLVERTRVLAEDLLKLAGVTWREVDNIIPVGGATRMPMIANLIVRLSYRGPRISSLSPDHAVSIGAALYAGILEGKSNESLIVDHPQGKMLAGFKTNVVSSRNLGIRVNIMGRLVVQTLIPRNSELPAVRRLSVCTTRTNQTAASIKIVECDGREPNANSLVCTCRLGDLPPNLPKGSIFDVELYYDAQGLLQLIGKHRDSGRLAAITTLYTAGVTE
jgi:molecular chaperone DnaK